MPQRLEWRPDYDGGLLRDGAESIGLGDIELPQELQRRIAAWMALYGDERLPLWGQGDQAWLEEGGILLRQVRLVLGEAAEVYVMEPWWGVPDEDFEQPGAGGHNAV